MFHDVVFGNSRSSTLNSPYEIVIGARFGNAGMSAKSGGRHDAHEKKLYSGGSNNSSDETSAQVFSIAPASPGEQGVSLISVLGGSESSTGTFI